MGWLSGHEPKLRIMIEAYNQDGEGLGANKVGEGSGENEGRSEISQHHQKPTTKILLSLNRTILGTD
jgi:hypothetical protein